MAEKETMTAAEYTPHTENTQQRCGICSMFIRFNRFDGECTKVEGVVADGGWCHYFERKPEVVGSGEIKFAKVKQI